MPKTQGQDGVKHFEAHAQSREELSSDSARSTRKVQPGSGGDGHIVVEERGKPKA